MISLLIVDDEPLARAGLRDFLADQRDVEVVGECQDGPEALEAIQRLHPDVVLLDVQMPGLGGFDVLAALEGELPLVIFVTAWDNYALQAFEVHAVDYLLKPVERARFHQALDQARRQLHRRETTDAGTRIAALLDALERSGSRRRFLVKSAGRIRLIRADQVRWIEAAGNYARLHTQDGRHSVRQTMQELEAQLDPSQFLRIHRSYFVNLDAVSEIQHWVKGDLVVLLKGGGSLPLSRAYRSRLEERLGRLG
ncbi:MAG TPA: LytTR family transcriptional regulator DNA-binding domain-containing protein [Gemmatimonadales bacterium]|jgi:two-component system LytT family response regulator